MRSPHDINKKTFGINQRNLLLEVKKPLALYDRKIISNNFYSYITLRKKTQYLMLFPRLWQQRMKR